MKNTDLLSRRGASLWDLFEPAYSLDRLMRTLAARDEASTSGSRALTFLPHIDISENDSEVRITAELPGVDESDIDITLEKDGLRLRGEKKHEVRKEEDKGRRIYMERSYGSFERFFPLNIEVQEESVSASFDKGVLSIQIPKHSEARRTKKIQIGRASTSRESTGEIEVERRPETRTTFTGVESQNGHPH